MFHQRSPFDLLAERRSSPLKAQVLLSLCEEGCACHRRPARQPVVGKPAEEVVEAEESRLVRPAAPAKITPQWLQDSKKGDGREVERGFG